MRGGGEADKGASYLSSSRPCLVRKFQRLRRRRSRSHCNAITVKVYVVVLAAVNVVMIFMIIDDSRLLLLAVVFVEL